LGGKNRPFRHRYGRVPGDYSEITEWGETEGKGYTALVTFSTGVFHKADFRGLKKRLARAGHGRSSFEPDVGDGKKRRGEKSRKKGSRKIVREDSWAATRESYPASERVRRRTKRPRRKGIERRRLGGKPFLLDRAEWGGKGGKRQPEA